MKPVNKFLLVEPISESKKGSVFIPLSNNLPYKKGKVVSVSDQVKQICVGDEITYFRRGVALEKAEDLYDLVNEDSIMYFDRKEVGKA